MIIRNARGNAEYLALNENNKVQGELRDRLAPPVSDISKSIFRDRPRIGDDDDIDAFYSHEYDRKSHALMDKLAEQYGAKFDYDEPKMASGQFCVYYSRSDDYIADAVSDHVSAVASESGVSEWDYDEFAEREIEDIMIEGARNCGYFPDRYSGPMDLDTFSRMYNDMHVLGDDSFHVSVSYMDSKGGGHHLTGASLQELRLSAFPSWGVDDPGARDIIDDVFAKYKNDPENSAACTGVMNELGIIESERKDKKQALAGFNKAVSNLDHDDPDPGLESDLDRADTP